jgi:Uma2 family endonuclease
MALLETDLIPNTGRLEPAAGEPRRWRWTGDDLIRLGDAGILPVEGRFELLDGEIYQLMPPGPRHSLLVDRIIRLLTRLATHDTFVRAQNPIRLNADYEPQPDVAIIHGPEDRYLEQFPGPDDVLLVVEVSDSTLQHDRRLKLPAYAAAGIQECWIVNLPELQVEVYHEPSDAGYRTRRLYHRGEALAPLAIPGAALSVSDLLGVPAADVASEA